MSRKEAWILGGVILGLGLVAVFTAWALETIGVIVSKKVSEQACLDAGYAYVDFLAGQLMCVGVRDGNTVAEPLRDVIARQKD